MNTVETLFEEFQEYFTMDEITEMVNFVMKRTLIHAGGMDDAVRLSCRTAIPFIKQLREAQAALAAAQAQS
jgi:hypothetical protein